MQYNRSRSVRMPLLKPSTVTARRPTDFSGIRRDACSIVSAGAIVTTSLTITSSSSINYPTSTHSQFWVSMRIESGNLHAAHLFEFPALGRPIAVSWPSAFLIGEKRDRQKSLWFREIDFFLSFQVEYVPYFPVITASRDNGISLAFPPVRALKAFGPSGSYLIRPIAGQSSKRRRGLAWTGQRRNRPWM